MATYVNDLRLKEIATGDESGTWGTSTNTNLELIAEKFGAASEALSDASTATITMADGTSDAFRSLALTLTGSLSQACTVTLAPNTLSNVWMVKNSAGDAVTLSQGTGANVVIPNGFTKVVYSDGAGSGAAVVDVFDDLSIGPNFRIGNAAAEDTSLVFDGNAKDFYIGLDDSADKLVIGEGSTVGTNNILTITDDTVTIGDGAAADTAIVFDGNAQDFYIGLDDSADDLVIGKGSTVGTTPAVIVDENLNVGIGVAATRGPLHVHNTTDDADSNIHLTSNETGSASTDGFTISVSPGGASDGTVALIQRENASMKFFTNGTSRLEISNAGTATFEHPIVTQSGATQGYYIENNAGNATTPRITNDGNDWTVIRPGASGSDVAINNFANSANRVVFTDEGEVGIAQTDPKEKLHVTGAGLFEGNNVTSVNAMSAAAGIMLHASSPDVFVSATSSGSDNRNIQLRALNAGSSNANQVFLEYTGNVGIGTSSCTNVFDTQFASAGHTSGISITNTQTGGYGSCLAFNSRRSDGGASLLTAARVRTEGAEAWNSDANTSSNMVFETRTDNTLSEKMRILSTGGITFNGDTSVANALNDYEEGSFTMGVDGASFSSGTYNQTAYYTKIGQNVFFYYYTSAITIASASGNATLTGLPFTAKGAGYSLFQYLHGTGVDGSSTGGYINVSNTNMVFVDAGGTALSTYINGTTKYIMVQGVLCTDG